MRRLAVVLSVAAAGLVLADVALARRPSLSVSPSAVRPGGAVTLTGTAPGCPRGDTVFLISKVFPGHAFAGIGAVTTRVGAGGRFSRTARIRRYAARGTYVITARCGGGNLGVAAHLRVI